MGGTYKGVGGGVGGGGQPKVGYTFCYRTTCKPKHLTLDETLVRNSGCLKEYQAHSNLYDTEFWTYHCLSSTNDQF